MLHTGYNPSLVVLSVAIAVIASYTALDLGGRVVNATPRMRWAWVAGASFAMGGGIWSMHFVGMLAFEMAMPVVYGPGLTLLSFLIAVFSTGAAFAWVSRPGARPRDVLVSGPLMGGGVAAMHYTGMAAMQISGNSAYSAPIVLVSVAIAVTAATDALWLSTRQNNVGQKVFAAGIMGLAVAGMHYTGMAAATFTEEMHGAATAHPYGVGLAQQNLALYVAGATFAILFLGMLAGSLDQQRVARALHATEERFRAAAETVGDIIWTSDASGEMHPPQPDWERFTGQDASRYQGSGWKTAIHPDDVVATLQAWEGAVAGRQAFRFEHRVRRQDGAYRVCSARAVPLLEPDGSVREWVGVHEDITGRRAFEAALTEARDAAERANQSKSLFLANMSHELRTPLAAIIGYGDMLKEEIEDGCAAPDLLGDLEKIAGNARHLLGLINDVLDLSKIESGKMQVEIESFGADSLIEAVAESVQPLIAKKRNRLVLSLAPGGLGAGKSDALKLRQIIMNLLSNAAKFTDNGTITLSASRETDPAGGADWLIFTVADTGIGMTPDQIEALFQRFHQADISTTRRFGGTGLGLALCKSFTAMIGGQLTVESVAGQGSAFTLRLPATLDPALATSGRAGIVHDAA